MLRLIDTAVGNGDLHALALLCYFNWYGWRRAHFGLAQYKPMSFLTDSYFSITLSNFMLNNVIVSNLINQQQVVVSFY